MGKMFKDMQEAVAADPSLATQPIGQGLPGAAFELMASVQAEWMLTPAARAAGADPAFAYACRRSPFTFRGHFGVGLIAEVEMKYG